MRSQFVVALLLTVAVVYAHPQSSDTQVKLQSTTQSFTTEHIAADRNVNTESDLSVQDVATVAEVAEGGIGLDTEPKHEVSSKFHTTADLKFGTIYCSFKNYGVNEFYYTLTKVNIPVPQGGKTFLRFAMPAGYRVVTAQIIARAGTKVIYSASPSFVRNCGAATTYGQHWISYGSSYTVEITLDISSAADWGILCPLESAGHNVYLCASKSSYCGVYGRCEVKAGPSPCECHMDYTGDRCQTPPSNVIKKPIIDSPGTVDPPSTGYSSSSSNSSAYVGSGLGVGGFVVLCVIFCVYGRYKKSQKEQKQAGERNRAIYAQSQAQLATRV